MSKKNCIVVLGSGRSGTSVVSDLLSKLGANITAGPAKLSEQNPKGMFEDQFILNKHKELFELLGINHNLPIPKDFLNVSGVNDIRKELAHYVDQQINASSTMWGFKDPRTACFLPLWIRIFNPYSIIPKYVLCVRNPSAVVSSLHSQYNEDEKVGELFWLLKNVDALRHTGGNVFILHYEDLFSERAEVVLQELLTYTELSNYFTGNIQDVIDNTVSKTLNRSQWQPYSIENKWVKKLYEDLKKCRGAGFERKSLMTDVYDCHSAMKEFAPWNDTLSRLLNNSKDENKKLSELTNKKLSNKKHVVEKNVLLQESISIKDECKLYRERLCLLEGELAVAKKRQSFLEKKLKSRKNDSQKKLTISDLKLLLNNRESFRFRLGHMLVLCAKEKRRCVVLPFKLLLLSIDMVLWRGRNKQLTAMQSIDLEEARRVKESFSSQLGGLILSSLSSPRKLFTLGKKIKKLK